MQFAGGRQGLPTIAAAAVWVQLPVYNWTSCHKNLCGSPVISFALVLIAHDGGCCAETLPMLQLRLTPLHAHPAG
jgi:hypothetical protein